MTANSDKPAEKIRGLKDLQAIKEKVAAEMALRQDGHRIAVVVHMGTCGIAAGAREIMGAVLAELAASGRHDVRVTASSCIGACAFEPVMTVEAMGAEPVLYGRLDAGKARQIFREHVLGGRVVANHVFHMGKAS